MQRNYLLLLPFAIGIVLMAISFYSSYPLVSTSSSDYIFNHVNVLYWFSLALLLASMFLMAITTKNKLLKWILAVGIVLAFFSLSYFYSMMPTSDSQFFRGLNEYYFKTQNLSPYEANHAYYQWPAFFILAFITTSISGLPLASYEFLLYGLIGFLLASSLFVYATRKHKLDGFLVVTAFFVSLTYFLDYQAVPFSLALALLFLLFMLETHKKSIALIVPIVILYISLMFTHLFVPVFFVLYLFIRSLLEKNRKTRSLYGFLFIFSIIGYLVVEFTLARFSFVNLIVSITQAPPQLSQIVQQTTSTIIKPSPIDNFAQIFSRGVTIAFVAICIVGAILLLKRKRLQLIDLAILSTGLAYSVLGLVLNTLGERAISLLFIPIALGAAYLTETKFRKVVIAILLILVVLFTFVPLHLSFTREIQFQTQESYSADNFFLNHYNWDNAGLTVTDFRTNTYLTPKVPATPYIQSWLKAGEKADAILYTPQFLGLNLGNYTSMDNLARGQKLDILYNDGYSYVLINANR